MPIRTIHRGVRVLFFMLLAIMVSGFWSVDSTEAATPKRVTKVTRAKTRVAKTRATKGVRTKTAYSKRRPRVATAKAAAPALPVLMNEGGLADISSRAKRMIGSRYRYGGESPSTGFDCTGLVHYVYGDKANALPRSSAGMHQAIHKTSELRPGDIVFFGRGRVHHAAIYVGDGQVVHASTPRSGVRQDSLQTLSRALGYAGAGRVN